MSLLPLIGRFILALVIVIWAYRHVNTPEHSIQELQRNCRVAKELLGTINIPLLVVNQMDDKKIVQLLGFAEGIIAFFIIMNHRLGGIFLLAYSLTSLVATFGDNLGYIDLRAWTLMEQQALTAQIFWVGCGWLFLAKK